MNEQQNVKQINVKIDQATLDDLDRLVQYMAWSYGSANKSDAVRFAVRRTVRSLRRFMETAEQENENG